MATQGLDLPHSDVQIALSRFGLGPRPGDRSRVASDPRGAVRQELDEKNILEIGDAALESSADIGRIITAARLERRMERGQALTPRQEEIAAVLRKDGRMTDAKDDAGADMAAGGDMAGGKAKRARKMPPSQRAYRLEVRARIDKALECRIGYVERLTHFWANHFAVSGSKNGFVLAITGAYEREAIRPHVLGRFSDMLNAATRHPAMLRYLDNYGSTGPKSAIGAKRGVGLNENHARELLELHTLGVDGGYAQADVIALAKALTGWTLASAQDEPGRGAFAFDERRHEPGAQTVMGKRYAEGGEDQAQAILDDLARSPATAKHVARRLATAFVADQPPQALVDRLTKTFRDTDGDLKQVAIALATADEAWAAPRAKMRSPQEFVFACTRAFDDRPRMVDVLKGLDTLGQSLWRPPSPQGFSLVGADWVAPDAQTNRLDLASDMADRNASSTDPNALAEDLLGDVLSDETRSAVKRAGSREQALALLLMSPEMQRR
ncbi:DUF1800 domain-containing protein [Hansschlegelia sp. KR7-227]|uniref:DUF1800 domain-containing protein n=1 Tax=Hansschlegelia sp. KR7-227 TaxID=3400914 RepID=UPI003C0DEFD7